MNGEMKMLDHMLAEYGFASKVPPVVRREFNKDKGRIFRQVYRNSGGYSASFAFLASIFFFMKKLGIGLGFTQSIIAFFTAATLTVAGLTYGTYSAVRAVRDHGNRQELKVPSPIQDKKSLPRPAIPRPAITDEITSGAHPFTGGSAPSLSIGTSSITVMGLSPDGSTALRQSLSRSIERHYPGPVTRAGAASLSLRGSLIKTQKGLDLYLRLVRPDGSILDSFQYSSSALSGLLSRTDSMVLEIARKVRSR